jgi:hypothetical protein
MSREAVTNFADLLSLNMPDPARSGDEQHVVVHRMSTRHRHHVIANAERPSRTPMITAREATRPA